MRGRDILRNGFEAEIATWDIPRMSFRLFEKTEFREEAFTTPLSILRESPITGIVARNGVVQGPGNSIITRKRKVSRVRTRVCLLHFIYESSDAALSEFDLKGSMRITLRRPFHYTRALSVCS